MSSSWRVHVSYGMCKLRTHLQQKNLLNLLKLFGFHCLITKVICTNLSIKVDWIWVNYLVKTEQWKLGIHSYLFFTRTNSNKQNMPWLAKTARGSSLQACKLVRLNCGHCYYLFFAQSKWIKMSSFSARWVCSNIFLKPNTLTFIVLLAQGEGKDGRGSDAGNCRNGMCVMVSWLRVGGWYCVRLHARDILIFLIGKPNILLWRRNKWV